MAATAADNSTANKNGALDKRPGDVVAKGYY